MGDQRGRTIDVPTANIDLHRPRAPLRGVFIVQVHGLQNKPLPAVANVGTRPTVDGKHWLLEVHLLDFNQDIYKRQLQVEFLQKVRDEMTFGSLDELKAQINKDVNVAREYFANN